MLKFSKLDQNVIVISPVTFVIRSNIILMFLLFLLGLQYMSITRDALNIQINGPKTQRVPNQLYRYTTVLHVSNRKGD